MPSVIPPFLGKNLTVTMTPQDVSAGGVWTDNALGACIFAGRMTEAGSSTTTTKDNISPMDCPNSNPVVFEQGTTYNLTEIQQTLAPSATANSLDKCARASFNQKIVVVWKDNAASTLRTETAYIVIDEYAPKYNKGMSPATLRCSTVAIGTAGTYTANPTVA